MDGFPAVARCEQTVSAPNPVSYVRYTLFVCVVRVYAWQDCAQPYHADTRGKQILSAQAELWQDRATRLL